LDEGPSGRFALTNIRIVTRPKATPEGPAVRLVPRAPPYMRFMPGIGYTTVRIREIAV